MQPVAHREAKSALWVQAGLMTDTLAAGSTANTYDAAPPATEGIDSWNDGEILPRRLMVVVNVGTVTGTGSLALTLRDSASAITTANGDASTALVAALTPITEAGMYIAEISLEHVFPNTDDDQSYIRRYHSLRAVATGADFEFSAEMIYCFLDRNRPTQDATELAVAYNDPS